MIEIVRYRSADAEIWNRFVAESRNGTFLHDRNFMEYHADRFDDHSLLFRDRENGKLLGVLPANLSGDMLLSHGGLTYGGLLTAPSVPAVQIVEMIESLVSILRERGVARLLYKPVPHIFHRHPAEEDIYALIRAGARIVRCDLASAVPLARALGFSTLRKRGVKKAHKAGLSVGDSHDFEGFWQVLSQTLQTRHDTRPVHDLNEIMLLAERFAGRIRLFTATQDTRILAGVVLFDLGRAVHLQYIAAAPEGRELGALDLVIDHLMHDVYRDRDWFSFGISTTESGTVLNEGLSRQKEMFGARGVVFQTLQLEISPSA